MVTWERVRHELRLAFWEGPRPRDDNEALELFDATWDALEESDEDPPPTPVIQALIEELEARWPGDHPERLHGRRSRWQTMRQAALCT